ncbi:hypothetical protein TIFTF001_042653 [Ficus carica]|uniref:Uncharacterized protein n=1 Tax=Ficus carica TaxID=3494 RepID=A0AA88CWI3_FICCA|nr:hypothetical protein TIFTF001_042653 [Ficus carica]
MKWDKYGEGLASDGVDSVARASFGWRRSCGEAEDRFAIETWNIYCWRPLWATDLENQRTLPPLATQPSTVPPTTT